jgi:hypothetical protein
MSVRCGVCGRFFDGPGLLTGIDGRQRLGQVEVNIVQSNLSLLDPDPYLDLLVALLPLLGFGIEFRLGFLRDAAGKRAGFLQHAVVVVQCLTDHQGQWRECVIECLFVDSVNQPFRDRLQP